jgi:hypothetical protein
MARIQRVTSFVANLPDNPGELLRVMQDLKGKNVSLSGLWGFATEPGKAQLYVVAKNPDKLRKAWKELGMLSEEAPGFLVTGTDRPGALLKTLEALAGAGINITAIDAIAVGGKFGSFIRVNTAEVDKAASLLGAK